MTTVMTSVSVSSGGHSPRAEGGRRAVPDAVLVRHALISVSDKQGLEDLASSLSGRGITVYSTGGTFNSLQTLVQAGKANFALKAISDLTGYPEMPGGLVKTLHPKIHAAILAEPFAADQEAYLRQIETIAFDLVVCNLYPFQKVRRLPGATVELLRQNIDIGGPTMVRAAAKNFLRVATVVDPADYGRLGAELESSGGRIGLETRWELARKAFDHVRDYDAAISEALGALGPADLAAAYEIGGQADDEARGRGAEPRGGGAE